MDMIGGRFAVRRWYGLEEAGAGGRTVERISVSVNVYPTVKAAEAAYIAAGRLRWLPAGSSSWGIEAEGFRPADAGAGAIGPKAALERLRARGASDAAGALSRYLESA